MFVPTIPIETLAESTFPLVNLDAQIEQAYEPLNLMWVLVFIEAKWIMEHMNLKYSTCEFIFSESNCSALK